MEMVGALWGERITTRRKELGLTQQRLGELCGIGQASISKVERGRLRPSDDLKWKLAAALQLSLDQLFAYPAIVPPSPLGGGSIPAPSHQPGPRSTPAQMQTLPIMGDLRDLS